MIQETGHIVSKFSWETSMKDRTLAAELQRRISSWSKEPLNRELNRVFDKICPEDQIWRIDKLEIDLGSIDFHNLEREFNQRLAEELSNQLIQLTLASYQQQSGIEIIDRQESELKVVQKYFESGYYPWSYRSEFGTLNEMITHLLRTEREAFMSMIRKVGRKEKVRKRIAWQVEDLTIRKLVQNLEPNNYETIFSLSDELVKLRKSSSLVQTETVEFRKNVWWWILNFLLTERGTLFNKIAFTKSVIQQTANHYNMDYHQLLGLIQKAMELMAEKTVVRSDFMVAILAITDEKKGKDGSQKPDREYHWKNFLDFLKNDSPEDLELFDVNEQIQALYRLDSERLEELLQSKAKGQSWGKILGQANVETLKQMVALYAKSSTSYRSSIFHLLFQSIRKYDASFPEEKFLRLTLEGLVSLSENQLKSGHWMRSWIKRMVKKSTIPEVVLLEKLEAAASKHASFENEEELRKLQIKQLRKKTGFSKEIQLNQLIQHFLATIQSTNFDEKKLDELRSYLIKALEMDRSKGLEELLAIPNDELKKKLVQEFLPADLIHRMLLNGKGVDQTIWEIHRQIFFALNDRSNEFLTQEVVEEIITFVNRSYLLQGGKVNFGLLKQVLWKQANRIDQTDYPSFLKWVNTLLTELKGTLSISKSQEEELKLSLKAVETHSFDQRWNFWKDDRSVSKERIIEWLKTNFQDAGFRQIRSAKEPKLRLMLERLFTSFRWNDFEDVLNRWSRFESAEKIKETGKEKKVDVIFQLVLVAGAEVKPTKVLELLVEYLTVHNPTISEDDLWCAFTNKDAKEKTINRKTKQLQLEAFQQSLFKGETHLTIEGERIAITDFFLDRFQTSPTDFLPIFKENEDEKVHLDLIRKVGLSQFLLVLSTVGMYRDFFQAVLEWYQISKWFISEGARELLERRFIQSIFAVLRSGERTKDALDELIRFSLDEIITSTALTVDQVVAEVEDRKLRLSPELIGILVAHETSFLRLQDHSETEEMNDLHEKWTAAQVGKSFQHLIQYAELPLWMFSDSSENVGDVLNALFRSHGNVFLLELRRRDLKEAEALRLQRKISFLSFIELTKKAATQKSGLLNQLGQLYRSLSHIPAGSYFIGKIQRKMYQDLLRSWITDDWGIFSSDRFWKELIWELSRVSGYRERELTEVLSESRLTVPAAFRLSLDNILKSKGQKHLLLVQRDEVNEVEELQEIEEEEPALEEEGIHVKNAGMVLLNNYVQMLFERTGLSKEDKFVDDRSQHKAVHYLQFAGTANVAVDEGFLSLNKVLCGLHPTEVIQSLKALDKGHQEIVDGMISAMIAYWKEIGETSVMGFRGNWLVRDGLLVEQLDRWDLTVEKRPYDILLNQAPFSFSIIRYPWMKKPLHVNWSY